MQAVRKMDHSRRTTSPRALLGLAPFGLVLLAGLWMGMLQAKPTYSSFSSLQETGFTFSTGHWQVEAGETLRFEGDASGFWEVAVVVLPPPNSPDWVSQRFGVTGRLCLTNTSSESALEVWLSAQVEEANPGEDYLPVPGARFEHQAVDLLEPGQARCFVYRQEFQPVQGSTYRLTAWAGLRQKGSVEGLAVYNPQGKEDLHLFFDFSLPDDPEIISAVTATPLPTMQDTPTSPPTETPTLAASATATSTTTATAEPSGTLTATVEPSATLTLAPPETPAATETSVMTPSELPTVTEAPTETPNPTITPSPETPNPTFTPSPETLSPTDLPPPTETPTPVPPPPDPTATQEPTQPATAAPPEDLPGDDPGGLYN